MSAALTIAIFASTTSAQARNRADLVSATGGSDAIDHATLAVVTSCEDSGAGSLREAVANAFDGDSIDLSRLPCSDSTITLTSGAIPVAVDDLLISGSPILLAPADGQPVTRGALAPAAIIDGNGHDRVFDHSRTGTLTLSNVELRNGAAQGPGGCVHSTGGVDLISTVISGCAANESSFGDGIGGGVFVNGDLFMTSSRISGNAANGYSFARGGGIFVGGMLTMTLSTIADNTALPASAAFGFGGGAYVCGATSISYSTISGNRATTVGGVDLLGANYAALSVVNSTISGNSGQIGGMLALQAPLHMAATTIAFNTSTVAGGIGGLSLGNTSTLQSTLIANNLSPDGPSDIAAQCGPGSSCEQVVQGANNLFMSATLPTPADTLTDDPLLAPLADNGGGTLTHALAATSPAIDRGAAAERRPAQKVTLDQRYLDYARVVGASADIGAFEYGAGPDRIFTNGFDGCESCPQP